MPYINAILEFAFLNKKKSIIMYILHFIHKWKYKALYSNTELELKTVQHFAVEEHYG